MLKRMADGATANVSLADLMCRQELSYELLAEIDEKRPVLPKDVVEQVEIELKYEGYIER